MFIMEIGNTTIQLSSLLSILVAGGGLVGIYVSLTARMAKLETRVDEMAKRQSEDRREIKDTLKVMQGELKELLEAVNRLLGERKKND